MLTIVVGDEAYDEEKKEFVVLNAVVLELEHSLVSLSKWESKFKKPFLGPDVKTSEEVVEYVRCMVLTPNIAPEVFEKLTDGNVEQINKYISDSMTATWFREDKTNKTTEVITNELIYYWLTVFRIPFEVQHWHLNRLLTLIQVCTVKNSKQKPMGRAEAAAMQRQLNAERRARLGTSG